LRKIQIELMNELGVEKMDVYEAYWLSADHYRDGLHYTPKMSMHVLNWFYKNASEFK
jgi:hypothetical protein